jgi:hypothetical protein
MLISASEPLVFVHMPKTGGMSLFTGLCQAQAGRIADLYNLSSRDASAAAPLLNDTSCSVYAGHFSFGLHEWLTRPVYYMSVVRHPVKRILSLYLFVSEYRRRFLRRAANTGSPVATLVLDKSTPDYYADFLPWIAGRDTLRTFLECPAAELDNGMVRRFSGFGLRPEACPDSALELAKYNIEQFFSVVGVLERFAQTIELLRRTLELHWIEEQQVNGTREKAEFNVEAQRHIANMNRLDLDLYAWIVARFERQLVDAPQAIRVPGGGRKDFENTVLWKAVGLSPVRQAMALGPAQLSTGEC